MSFIQLAWKLAGILSSSTILIIGSIVLLRSMSLDFESVLYACKLSITGAFVAGLLGYHIGKTFEKANSTNSKSGENRRNPGLIIDDILNQDLGQLEIDENNTEQLE